MQIAERREEEVVRTKSVWEDVLKYCKEKAYGLALWRLPNSSETHLLISFQPYYVKEEQIETLPKGFLIASFRSALDKKKCFLPSDVHVSFQQGNEENAKKIIAEKLPDFGMSFPEEALLFQEQSIVEIWQREEKLRFEELVKEAVEIIQAGQLKKIVLARNKSISISPYFSIGSLWDKVCGEYPSTFNSLIYLPEHGVWMGASPELLASKDAGGLFRTVALAGTQKTQGRGEKEAVWSQKEIEEQAYVRRYIIDCLKHIRLREFEDIGPKTVRVGHLFHLRTDFIVDLNEVDFPHLVSLMVDLLHPTAAVCGTPKKEALEFILGKEGFERELYGGYLGPVNVQNETHLFVNLRCARFESGKATFFAGAGITEDSVAESEYLETESKMESLLRLF